MNIDLLDRKSTHSVLWAPGQTAPGLVIGTFQPGAANFSDFQTEDPFNPHRNISYRTGRIGRTSSGGKSRSAVTCQPSLSGARRYFRGRPKCMRDGELAGGRRSHPEAGLPIHLRM